MNDVDRATLVTDETMAALFAHNIRPEMWREGAPMYPFPSGLTLVCERLTADRSRFPTALG